MQAKFGPVSRFLQQHETASHDAERCLNWAIMEFNSLPSRPQFPQQDAHDNMGLNRYCNVLPYDYNRVHLDTFPGNPYINASIIRGPQQNFSSVAAGDTFYFVASQGPTRVTRTDMVRLIAQLKSPAVIMLSSLVEGGREKVANYLPDTPTGELHLDDGWTIQVVRETFPYEGVHVRDLRISYHPGAPPSSTASSKRRKEKKNDTGVMGGTHPCPQSPSFTHTTRHIAMENWPDFGVPETTDGVRHIAEELTVAVGWSDKNQTGRPAGSTTTLRDETSQECGYLLTHPLCTVRLG